MTNDVQSLPGALAAEIRRVAELKAVYAETARLCPSANMKPVIAMMDAALDAAVAAANSPDVVDQAHALEALRGFDA